MTEPKNDDTSITRDPVYYTTAAFFALLTSALPSILGQPNFLPIVQTLALAIFMVVALHHRNVRGAITLMAIWLVIQFVVLTLLTRLFRDQLEGAFHGGFAYRGAITNWFFGGASYPSGITTDPSARIVELARIVLGSIATAGLYGIWVLIGIVNQSAFGTGILLASLANPAQSLLVIPYWTLLRTAGYAGLIVLCAMTLLTYTWSPSYYWQNHRRLIAISVALVLLGLLAELFLPGLVARPPLT